MSRPARRAGRGVARGAWALLAACLLAGGPSPTLAAPAAAPAATEGWRAEFDEICSKTQDAMALPADELKRLVARADALLPKLEKLEPSQRKVMEKRLAACRNLFQFVLDSKEAG